MTQQAKQGQNGFTLVELMVSMGIFVLIMLVTMLALTTANTTYFSADARISTQEELRRAMKTVVHEISEGNRYRVNIPQSNRIVFQIPIKVVDGGTLDGLMIDERNNILFGARPIPSTIPDGDRNYAIQYILVPNNDVSGSNQLVRRVLDAYPAGNQVGSDLIIANYIQNIAYSRTGDVVTMTVSAVKHNKFNRNVQIASTFAIVLRN